MTTIDNKLLAVVGPTATGKSELACYLSQHFSGEIVIADSRQIYRHMDIGTAKPPEKIVSQVPHHLLSIIDPDQPFSLAQYQTMAFQAIASIHGRDKLPVLTGGSGQYVWAVIDGWRIPVVPPDQDYRHRLEASSSHDKASLHRRLTSVDPEAGARIDPRNVRRVIRALELRRHTGEGATDTPYRKTPIFNTCIIGLTGDREEIYRRIDRRVDRMVSDGLVAELEKLLKMGYGEHLPSLSGIGYRQIIKFLKGDISLPVAVQQTKYETHRYVRQQYNWFRLQDERIKWFNISERPESAIRELVARFLEGDTD